MAAASLFTIAFSECQTHPLNYKILKHQSYFALLPSVFCIKTTVWNLIVKQKPWQSQVYGINHNKYVEH